MSGEQCFKHPFEIASAPCRNCGIGFCDECLVFSFGPKKPPYCIPCALGASGVRANSGRVSGAAKREVRRIEKERRKTQKHPRKTKPDQVEVEVEVVGLSADTSQPEPATADNPYAWADDSADDRVPST